MNPFLDGFLFVWRLIFPSNDATVLDHVNVPKPSTDWRDAALEKARTTYARPWACGPSHHPREVLVGERQTIVVGPGETPTKRAQKQEPKVTALKAAKR